MKNNVHRFAIALALLAHHQTVIASETDDFIATFSDETTYDDLYKFWRSRRGTKESKMPTKDIQNMYVSFIDKKMKTGNFFEAITAYGNAQLDSESDKKPLLDKITENLVGTIRIMKTQLSNSRFETTPYRIFSQTDGVPFNNRNYSYAEAAAELIMLDPAAIEELFRSEDISNLDTRAVYRQKLIQFVEYLRPAGAFALPLYDEYKTKPWAMISPSERHSVQCVELVKSIERAGFTFKESTWSPMR